jgi:small-conductance mechanosensitive channel
MNPLMLVLRLPILPAEGVIRLGEAIESEVIRLAEVIEEEAQRELHDPARIRRELEEAQRRRDAGEISEEELTDIQDQLTQAMVTVPAQPSAARPDSDGS